MGGQPATLNGCSYSVHRLLFTFEPLPDAPRHPKQLAPMNLTDLIGTLAALLTTLSFVPQAWHTFQTKDVSGISLGMYSAFTLGVALWLAYGLMLQAWPVVIANAVTLALALGILAMKLIYQRARN
jgi:MtN3 and saliva related transmembrane protein